MLIPEEHGGLGLGLLEAALIAEALGKHVVPVPFLGTAVMAPLALMMAGTPAQQKRWLPKLASGEARASVAVTEYAGGARENAGVDGRAAARCPARRCSRSTSPAPTSSSSPTAIGGCTWSRRRRKA